MIINLGSIVKTLVDNAKAGNVYLIEKTSYEQELIDHFLDFDERGRYLRFGQQISNAGIEQYVKKFIKPEDKILAIFNNKGKIVAAVHMGKDGFDPDGYELGLSVSNSCREKGFGSKIFSKGIEVANALGAKRIYTYCLTENKAMQALAKKHNLKIVLDHGDYIGKMEIEKDNIAEILNDVAAFFTSNQIMIIDKVMHDLIKSYLEQFSKFEQIAKSYNENLKAV